MITLIYGQKETKTFDDAQQAAAHFTRDYAVSPGQFRIDADAPLELQCTCIRCGDVLAYKAASPDELEPVRQLIRRYT